MKIGFIGLGKMGLPMTERLLKGGHEVVVYNRSRDKVETAVSRGAEGASSVEELSEKLEGRKVVWLMVPSGSLVDSMIEKVSIHMNNGDIIIDGGNSNWKDSVRRGKSLSERGIWYIDCGTSGGVWGLENGYCLMYGGEKEPCSYAEPLFKTLAPDKGYLHCGKTGSGHFVKMVHNGIEYGMMQAYAEGFAILEKSEFNIDNLAVSRVWQQGSVVRSWLLELAERAFTEDPELENLEPFVSDSGEGRWTVDAAVELGVPAPVISSSIFSRFQSQGSGDFSMKILSALRNQFGGHAVREKGKSGV